MLCAPCRCSAMSFVEALQSLAVKSDLGCKFFLLFDPGDSYELVPVDIGDEDDGCLLEIFISRVQEIARALHENSVQPISTADGREGGIYHFDLDNVPQRLQSGFEALNVDDSLLFHRRLPSMASAKALLILLGKGEERICLYKHIFPVSILRKKNMYEHVVSAGAAPSRLRLASNDLLRLDGSFHFIYAGESMYCLGAKIVQTFYGFTDAILAKARASVDAIKSASLVGDLDKMIEKLDRDDVALARKIVRAVGVSKVLGRVPADRVIAFTKDNKFYAGKFKYSANGERLELTSMVAIKLFLKLIGDDCLYSELTDSFYDVTVKDPLEV